ncbi:MAG: Histidinol dehydrogenase [Chloroflexi bacterium ADurb.Bin325]|nr:MAG: Histidinol dehydrogenase [Chloroflexi bacterium ADurb.Bin325]
MPVVNIYTSAEAREGILRRAAWEDQEMPARLLDGIAAIFGERISPAEAVGRILRDIRARGDAAVVEWSARIDGNPNPAFEVERAAWQAAYDRLPAEQRAALDLAAERIARFHRKQPMDSWVDAGPDGTLGQLIRPLDRAGVYVPGGTAPLPSSLLMAALPARVAGVGQVVVCTPPNRQGQIHDLILAAAHVAQIDRLFALGGAQAIAALAYGTETVPAVDKIVGAGGLFITLAKRQVIGAVGIDGFYGPTETVVIADEAADPAWAAADLLAQAEHDVLASPILLTPSRTLADAVAAELGRQLAGLERADIAAASLADRGGIVLTADLAEAVALANAYAPEHLCLLVADPWALVGHVRNAGGVFVGEHSFEVLGDYVAGPSHVMPTEGSARYSSPLSVADFVKRISLIALDAGAGARLSAPAAVLARGEGLTAHARAAEMRTDAGRGSTALTDPSACL